MHNFTCLSDTVILIFIVDILEIYNNIALKNVFISIPVWELPTSTCPRPSPQGDTAGAFKAARPPPPPWRTRVEAVGGGWWVVVGAEPLFSM